MSDPTLTPTSTRIPNQRTFSDRSRPFGESGPDFPPQIIDINLLSEWDDFGDVLANQLDSIPQGTNALLGIRVIVSTHRGRYRFMTRSIVWNSDDIEIASRRNTVDETVTDDRPRLVEMTIKYPTSDWQTGMKTTEVIVHDEVSGLVAEPMTTSFEIE